MNTSLVKSLLEKSHVSIFQKNGFSKRCRLCICFCCSSTGFWSIPGYQYDLDITVIAPNGQTGAQDPDLYIYDVAENLYGFDADSGPGGINTANAFISATFEPGTYYFGVSRGIKSSSDFNYSFSININQVTPVPEPESGALVALGLGVIGFISRRKRQ